MNIGYACINMQLSYPQKYGGKEKGVKPITTGRSMIKRTFESKGLDYASELALANAMDWTESLIGIYLTVTIFFVSHRALHLGSRNTNGMT